MRSLLRKTFLAALALGLCSLTLQAQNITEQTIVDSSAFIQASPQLDSTLAGVNILSLIDEASVGQVTIYQSRQIEKALSQYIEDNRSRKITGYRVRIYFDNSQNARGRSEAVAREFAAAHPEIRVYRSHESPYFRVTVGDFRSKNDAQKFAKGISNQYPSVFIVKESIHYPDL